MLVVYGGALSPVTLAHEKIINELSKQFKVIVMPVGDKYKKNELLHSRHRLNMLHAVGFNKNISISKIEINNPNILHTYETLLLLKKEYPNEDIKFVIGSDNLISFHTWRYAEEILKEFGLIVIQRDTLNFNEIINSNNLLLNYVHNIKLVNLDITQGISSTNLRNLLKQQCSIEELNKYVNPKVLDYILENKLFKIKGDR